MIVVSIIRDIAGESIVDNLPFESGNLVIRLFVHCRIEYDWGREGLG